jgi:hypothetical protein
VPNLPESARLWYECAEIDYIGPFVKGWAAFNGVRQFRSEAQSAKGCQSDNARREISFSCKGSPILSSRGSRSALDPPYAFSNPSRAASFAFTSASTA